MFDLKRKLKNEFPWLIFLIRKIIQNRTKTERLYSFCRVPYKDQGGGW